MARYALINPGGQVARLAFNVDPSVETKSGWKWLPCEPISIPAHDQRTQKITGPTYTVNETDVTESYNIVDLSAQEISNKKASAVSAINGTYRPIMKILLDHENRIRDQHAPPLAALTIAEFEDYIKGKL